MYGISQLFFYRPLFMFELLVAEYMFAQNLRVRSRFALRALLAAVVCFGASFAVPIVSFSTLYGSFLFLVMFLVSLGAMAFVFDEPLKNVLFCAIAGITVQHLAQELYEFFNVAADLNGKSFSDFYGSGGAELPVGSGTARISATNLFLMIIYTEMYVVIYTFAFAIFGKKLRKYDIIQLKNATILIIAVLLVVVDIVFGAIIIWSLPDSVDRVSVSMLHIYNILCCALALLMLFELPRRRSAENELTVLKQLQHREREQYLTAKENVELINVKCHDLKHQIRRLRAGENVSGSALGELENAIDIYDSTYRTSNEALNVILMEKSLVCKKESVNLSCIIDADGLCFMSEADVYSLFGNMLDNAIEASRLLDADRRSVGLTVKRVRNFIAITIYNGFLGELKFENGLPVTTKSDKAYHGFGLKSIHSTVEKYDGVLRISAENGIFCLKILFPVEKNNVEKTQFTD